MHADEVGHNETLIAGAIASWGGDTSDVLVATKGGHLRPGDGTWYVDGRPEYLKKAAEASLARLGGAAIGLYQFHRPDPAVPYADSIGALVELLDAGTIRLAGISNANVDQIRLARGSSSVDASRACRTSFLPRSAAANRLELCTELGIAFIPWSPLGGISSASRLGERFAPFQQVAADRGVSPQVVCLAWHLAKSPVVIPIPGASRPESIRDSVQAAGLLLTPEELALLG
ncbi:aldo/keto reductase [Cryobacterium breve]|uniref:Aldo/keto reductase n=1 Tax=Cryobacterium breve TaxID=1259258 RepID=A0ABY7NJE6_9MICO|nr:aldo/keto reductase [Cryobacterium breve]WBM81623.1 aldo/keto reductase [Cryobacterium breve]